MVVVVDAAAVVVVVVLYANDVVFITTKNINSAEGSSIPAIKKIRRFPNRKIILITLYEMHYENIIPFFLFRSVSMHVV